MRGRLLLLILAVALLPAAARAQDRPGGGVRGLVVTTAGQPLSGVRVAVRAAGDTAVVGGAVSAANGRFQIDGLRPGRYTVEGSLLGYTPFQRRDVALSAADPVADLGSITLSPKVVMLEGLVAQGERSAVQVAPDRTIYSTREMPVAQGGMATDVLSSVPELEVDTEGSVSLRGQAAQIYLNGRPAPMEGESLQLFLQQFPADRIDRVEVIPNPSARFQAEGSAGIVNIVLKRDVDLGLSGSVFLNGGTRGELGGGGRLTYQRGPLTLFGGSFLRMSQRDNTSYDLRQNLAATPVTLLEQDAWSERSGLMAAVDLTAEYKLNQRSTVWTEGRVFRRGNDSDVLTAYTLLTEARSPLERYDRDREGEARSLSTDLNLGFRHVMEPQRHYAEVELQFEAGGDQDLTLDRRLFLLPSGEDAGLPVELTREDEDEDELEMGLEADYVRPLWGEGQLEVGYRAELQETDSRRLLRVFASEGDGAPASVTDRGFAHHETFHSAYVTLMRRFGPLGVQAGVRAEKADTWLEVPGGDRYENDYASLFPSANVRYDLGDGREVRLAYSRRIRRPGPWVLNPINSSTDPLNRRVGNPDIDPQYTHNVSLETSWSGQMGTLRFSPFYQRTVDDWAEIKRVDQAGVSTVTWENLASVESYGSTLTANVREVRGLSGFASLSGYREVRDASNLAAAYSGTSTRWSARGNLQARLSDDLSLQTMAFFQPARDVPQGHISSSLMTHIGLRHQFWNDKASLNLMLRDPLDVYRSSFTTRDPTHVQTGRSEFRMRSAVLSFSYSFGRPPRGARGQQEPEGEPEPEAGIR